MRYLRHSIARWLIHLGLRVMPPGRARSELDGVIREWGEHVVRTVHLSSTRFR
jgi:hypothetical protein